MKSRFDLGLTPADREILGACAGFAVFLFGVARLSSFAEIDTHAAPAPSMFLGGLAIVLGAAVLAFACAALVGGARRRRSIRWLALALLLSSVLTLLHTRAWESGWLAVLVLVTGGLMLVLARTRSWAASHPRASEPSRS